MYLSPSIHFIRQILLTSTGFVNQISGGATLGFTSVLFAQLKDENSVLLTPTEESWIASGATVLLFPASILSIYIIEKLGRKLTQTLAEIISLTSWIILILSKNYIMFLSSRLLFSIHTGIIYPVSIIFIGETTWPKHRTMFLSSMAIGLTIGTFLCQYLGQYLHWKTLTAIFLCAPVYNIFILFCLKESYVTLLDRNKLNEAQESFEWYRGETLETKKEFDEIILDKKKRRRDSFKEILQMCMRKTFLIPFGITTVVYLTNEVTAIQAVVFYTSKIIQMINDDSDFEFYAILALNIIRIMAVILGLFLVKISNLRVILISSGYCLGISLLLLALFMYLSEIYVGKVFPILSLCTLVMNTVLYSIGLGPLPSAVCAEMFPEATRSIGGSLSVALSFLFLFIVVRSMPILLALIGSYWTFGLFGICTLVGITLSNWLLPNAKDKTLQEINMMYQESEEREGEIG